MKTSKIVPASRSSRLCCISHQNASLCASSECNRVIYGQKIFMLIYVKTCGGRPHPSLKENVCPGHGAFKQPIIRLKTAEAWRFLIYRRYDVRCSCFSLMRCVSMRTSSTDTSRCKREPLSSSLWSRVFGAQMLQRVHMSSSNASTVGSTILRQQTCLCASRIF
ncbi:hypothetical protein V5799_008013 [Amblyomma americanum]|uniref:Uncharacterized protein n=1 Tax=Amblyomma americanum TaxID=6943 RepID=A0AAQ4FFP6_AMBAM